MSLYSYICAYCNKYRVVATHPTCPCRASDVVHEAPFQLGIFRPYTETEGRGQPTFETRQERDAWLKANGMTYETNNYGGSYKPAPLIDDKLEHEILTRAATGEPVALPTVSDAEIAGLTGPPK